VRDGNLIPTQHDDEYKLGLGMDGGNTVMFKEFADEKHKEQAEEFLLSLGKLTHAFERVCAEMRYLIMFMLRSQGLKNQDMEQVIIGDRGARDLQELFSALYGEFPDHDEDDRKAVKDLLESIDRLTKGRNKLVHGNWDLGTEGAEEEYVAVTLRFRKKRKKGALVEELRSSTADANKLIQDAKRAQVLLQRLQRCICQTGFKVATEFDKAL
jgi:hypothetical protein